MVDAVRCAIEVQNGLIERNAGLPPERRIEFRVGIHLGDVVEESDGDLMGDGVNIAARLEGICKPGAVCLSEDAYQVKGRLDLAVTELGPTELKNIADPIRVYSLEVGAPAQAKPTKRKTSKRPLAMLGATIVALAVIASVGAYFLSANRTATVGSTTATPAEPARLSIVVLPFTNLSNDPNQDYFADGITENLTTELSRIHNSFVIARNTAFSFKGKNVDARDIGKELGVRYVLEGSVQRDGTRVRVNTQLIDSGSGAHLWADRFEEDVADLFKLEDQVVARLANSLGYELVKTEAEKSARSKSPDAVDLAMRGWALVWQEQQQQRNKANNNAAEALFEQALKIDPSETDALAGDALTYLLEYTRGWATAGTDYEAKILGQADRAIALAPDNVWAYNVKSLYLTISQRANEGLSAADAGLAINPDDPPLYRARGTAELVLGHYEQAKSDVQQAIRLSPRDPTIGLWLVTLGDAELGLGHFGAATDEYKKAIDAGWRAYQPYRGLAAAYALDGKMEEAASALAKALRLNPMLTLKWVQTHSQSIPPLLEGLRKAGLPEE